MVYMVVYFFIGYFCYAYSILFNSAPLLGVILGDILFGVSYIGVGGIPFIWCYWVGGYIYVFYCILFPPRLTVYIFGVSTIEVGDCFYRV